MINIWEVEVLQVLLVGQVKKLLEDASDLSYSPFATLIVTYLEVEVEKEQMSQIGIEKPYCV